MNDPIEGVLDQLSGNRRVREARFSSNFLNNVGDVLEREGFATTRLYLGDKKTRTATARQAGVLLTEVLPVLEACARIRQNRAIGRYIIKALPTLKAKGKGGKR